MPIKHCIWTSHAESRCRERLLDRSAVERAVRDGHPDRRLNQGQADWLIEGLMADGRRFEVLYDHPHGVDRGTARIISVWDF